MSMLKRIIRRVGLVLGLHYGLSVGQQEEQCAEHHDGDCQCQQAFDQRDAALKVEWVHSSHARAQVVVDDSLVDWLTLRSSASPSTT